MIKFKLSNLINFLLPVIIFSVTAFSLGPNDLIDPCKPEPEKKCLQLIPVVDKGPAVWLAPEAAQRSLVLKNMIADLGGEDSALGKKIPIQSSRPILLAFINTLNAITTNKDKSDSFIFLKDEIKKSLALLKTSKEKKAEDIINFLKVASYLDVNEFIRPSAALWVDCFFLALKSKPKNSDAWRKISRQFFSSIRELVSEKSLESNLSSAFYDYFNWLKFPYLDRIVLSDKNINVHINSLAVLRNKLYASDTPNARLLVINLTNPLLMSVNKPIETLENPRSLIASKNKLYIATSSSDAGGGFIGPFTRPNASEARKEPPIETISVFNSRTIHPIESPLNTAFSTNNTFARAGNKIYVSGQHKIYTINADDEFSSKSIKLPVSHFVPTSMVWNSENLYVSIPISGIKVIDGDANKIIRTIKIDAKELAAVGTKLYVVSTTYDDQFNSVIKVIDTTTDKPIGSDIPLEGQNNAIPMAVMDNEWLFVADSRAKAVHIIDTKTDQILFDIPIKLSDEKRIVAMTVFNNTLFIASENVIWAMRLSPAIFNYYGKK